MLQLQRGWHVRLTRCTLAITAIVADYTTSSAFKHRYTRLLFIHGFLKLAVYQSLQSIQGDHSPDNMKFSDISPTVRGTPP